MLYRVFRTMADSTTLMSSVLSDLWGRGTYLFWANPGGLPRGWSPGFQFLLGPFVPSLVKNWRPSLAVIVLLLRLLEVCDQNVARTGVISLTFLERRLFR